MKMLRPYSAGLSVTLRIWMGFHPWPTPLNVNEVCPAGRSIVPSETVL
jgi:hypothetical protein